VYIVDFNVSFAISTMPVLDNDRAVADHAVA
jgi:hypothetical protein